MQTNIIIAVIGTAIFLALLFIHSKQTVIILKLNHIIMTEVEMLAALEEADQATNDIAADIQVLIDNKEVSPAAAERLTAHVSKLKGIAAER